MSEQKIDIQISNYINANAEGDLSVQKLCSVFHLSNNELYSIFKEYFMSTPAEYVKKYAGRTPVVHLKDFFGEKSDDMYELIGEETKPKRPGGFEFRPVGHGLQNFPAILKAADEAGAEWVVVEQDKPSMGLTPMECAKASIDYLRSIQ